MASKAKHAKRSQYSSHNYKAFPMFIRNAAIKENTRAVYTNVASKKEDK